MRALRRTDAQASFIRTFLIGLDPFLALKGTIPATAIKGFLLIADKEGLSVGEYARRADTPLSTMSRHLRDIGPSRRNHEPGAGLIEARGNPENGREKLYYLTPKGRGVLAAMRGRA